MQRESVAVVTGSSTGNGFELTNWMVYGFALSDLCICEIFGVDKKRRTAISRKNLPKKFAHLVC